MRGLRYTSATRMNHLPRTLDILNGGIADGTHPGWQLYASVNGEPVADAAGGEARPGGAMTAQTRTLWMSAGKPVTAVAILQLVGRGLIGLDAPVVDVLPEFGANGKGAITLRQILNHTAGFRGPLNNFTPGTWDEILARVYALKQEPGWVPGERGGYHIGSSWFVLGELVRRLTGKAIDAYAAEEIFAPLAERTATIGLAGHANDADDVALMSVTEKQPATTDWPGNTPEANALPRPGANARGPIRALGRLYEALLQSIGGAPAYAELLPAELARAMAAPSRVGMIDQTFKQTLDWGLGVMLDSKKYAGEHPYGFGPHASPLAFGHGGNQSSSGFADPGFGLVVAWTCNGMPGESRHQARASAINRAIYEDLTLA